MLLLFLIKIIMKALITVGCKTDHGGIIALGDPSFLVEGKASLKIIKIYHHH